MKKGRFVRMEQKKIDRINELARKSRGEGLTEQEKEEQAALRKEYIDSYRRNLVAQLDNIVVVDPQGNHYKPQRKGKKEDIEKQ